MLRHLLNFIIGCHFIITVSKLFSFLGVEISYRLGFNIFDNYNVVTKHYKLFITNIYDLFSFSKHLLFTNSFLCREEILV